MKKSRILSALTSVAMIGTMITSALPFTAVADSGFSVDMPTDFVASLKPDKTSFTMDEVKAGNAKTKVSVKIDKFNDDEKITYWKSNFLASDSGIKISNLEKTEIGNSLTNVVDRENDIFFDFAAFELNTSAGKEGFFIQNTPQKYFVANDLNSSMLTFDVSFDPSMEAGEYYIDFTEFDLKSGASEVVGMDKNDPNYGTKMADYTDAAVKNRAVITLGDKEIPTTEATTESSQEKPSKNFVGDVKIWADKIEANPGDEVTVNMYADTNGVGIRGMEVRAIFDTSKLEITNMKQGKGFRASASINPEKGTYAIQSASSLITNNPEEPFATITFKVSEDAKPGEVYDIDFTGSNDNPDPVIIATSGGEGESYLKPVEDWGSVTIIGETTESSQEKPTKEFIGDVKIWADKVEANPGDEVTVNMYADTNGVGIRGMEVRAIFDTSKLEILDMKQGKGFRASASINPEKGTYAIQSASSLITNNPEEPFATITFKVSEDAKPGEVYDIDFTGSNDNPDPVIIATSGGEGESYLKPVEDWGSVTIVGETTEATTNPVTTTKAPATTTSETTVVTTTTKKTTEAPNTEISYIIVTSIEVVTSKEIVTEVSYIPVTSIEVVTSKEIVTEISYIPQTVEKITEIYTEISYIPVTSKEIVTEISYIPQTIEKITEISYIPVTSIEVVTSKEIVTEISYIIVTKEDVPTTTTTDENKDIEIVTNYDIDKDSDQWYHSDNVEFFKNGIVVKVGNVDVTDDAVISFADTPADIYDGKNFNYNVEFTVEYNGTTKTASIPVKIGPRGDVNMSGGDLADLYDAITVATFILPTKPIDIPKGSFQEFLGDNNEDGVVDLYDAINIAKLILPTINGDWTKVSKDYQNWIKT